MIMTDPIHGFSSYIHLRVIACQDKEHERVRQIHHWTAAERGLFNATKFLPDIRPFKVSIDAPS